MANSVSGYDAGAAAAEEARIRAEEERKRAEEEQKKAEEEARKQAEEQQKEVQETQEERKAEANNSVQEVLGANAAVNQTTVESIFGDDFYKDDTNISASQALKNMQNSSLYDSTVGDYFDRMVAGAEDLKTNTSWQISMDTDGDGKTETLLLADAIASSFDSELDLYIEEKVEDIVQKYGNRSSDYLSEAALAELASYGIRVDAVGDDSSTTNRAYAFSLVEIPDDKKSNAYEYLYNTEEGKNAKVLEDSKGKKGSYVFADCLIPDGYAQGAELNLSSILDQMGYDCVSKADFIGHESDYNKLMSEIETRLQNGEYKGNESMSELYSNRKDIQTAVNDLWGGSGSAPGVHDTSHLDSHSSSEDSDALSELMSSIEEKFEAKAKELRKKSAKNHNEYLYKLILTNKYKEEHGVLPTGTDLIEINEKAKQLADSSEKFDDSLIKL